MKFNNTVDNKYLKDICTKYKAVIEHTTDVNEAIEYFICLEYATELSNFTDAVDRTIIADMTAAIYKKTLAQRKQRTKDDVIGYKRFIIVLAQIESTLMDVHAPKFPMTKKALEGFLIDQPRTEETANSWPEYVSLTLEVISLLQHESAANVSYELLQKVR